MDQGEWRGSRDVHGLEAVHVGVGSGRRTPVHHNTILRTKQLCSVGVPRWQALASLLAYGVFVG
jgi:hypothetical protein